MEEKGAGEISGCPAGCDVINQIIDLEDRWFCSEWREETIHKPVLLPSAMNTV